ncbi:3-hydroxyacyl-CoA dehydrogenase NAD-binding domain-containing protein [Neobacillus sp. YX16]|uniref:3-hydroxyacyl-CoA dehydrogenase family protein n=1 Tax=Neobacillus sp. YX16 TaxID=3047874 RepID=UPI0024C2C3B7|nr:3-hydroxyacyl-CoA dehydrogenase NAD-binding domain-containing protein [Neobacillus sp. YX16]WHZ00869.1 3-hydroxyacyl-CoA dehydrogenase NAD-binding domain-containing protein [Neobacillus sp. YX16]
MKKLTVIGAGVMGRGIAYSAATSGFEVQLYDIKQEALNKAKESIFSLIDSSREKGFLSENKAQQGRENLSFTTSFEKAVVNAEFVIEAALEIMDVKIDIFKRLDELCPEETILATNTSTMSPTKLAAQTSRPEKCIAMHFFNPVQKMKLVEIIRGLETSDETVAKTKEIAETLGKETVEVNEFPGFVTSRMNCLIGNEAMNMLLEGVASAADIDKAIKLGLNHPMGPLELADLVGLDTRLRNMEYLYKTLGEKYRPCPLLIKYVAAGRLGKKSGKGFYEY